MLTIVAILITAILLVAKKYWGQAIYISTVILALIIFTIINGKYIWKLLTQYPNFALPIAILIATAVLGIIIWNTNMFLLILYAGRQNKKFLLTNFLTQITVIIIILVYSIHYLPIPVAIFNIYIISLFIILNKV